MKLHNEGADVPKSDNDKIFNPYEGEFVEDGIYVLGQLSKPRYGRVVIPGNNPDHLIYNNMIVQMDDKTFFSLFDYVKGRETSIHTFRAIVENHYILHIYEP